MISHEFHRDHTLISTRFFILMPAADKEVWDMFSGDGWHFAAVLKEKKGSRRRKRGDDE